MEQGITSRGNLCGLSVDPLFKDYLDINKYNDILDSRNINHYAYAFQNLVNYIDYK